MRAICLDALPRMFVDDEQLFCWCIRRGEQGNQPEGISRRYTAMVLLGLAMQEKDISPQVLPDGMTAQDLCGRLIGDVDTVTNLGDVAVTLWAAVAWKHPQAEQALQRLRTLDPINGPHPTVEIAWALTALSFDPEFLTDVTMREAVARRLLGMYNDKAGLFPHMPDGVKANWRGHVTCFADWVYPVQALSHYHAATGDREAIEAAKRSAVAMCELQGDGGQWWWHYDVRTGQVVEPFPVYSVHQNAMGPMALLALSDASGQRFDEAIESSVQWMIKSAERGDSLIDEAAKLIWRKVCRQEPGKLSRGLQAAASRVSPGLRTPGLNTVLPPKAVDYECRPYHLGWVLYTFADSRLS